jgi:hypothetical protein
MQTPFGGGKTHALLTLYHLIVNPAESLAVPGVKEALGDFEMPAAARVLVFDGQEHGIDPIEKETGASVSTMWGELAYQVDPALHHRLIIDSDAGGVAPGNAVFRRVLEAAAPCLVLIDEVVSYLVKLKFSNTKRTQNLYRQTTQFMQEMLQLAGNVPGVCVLMSLPKSRAEFGGLDPEQTQRELGVTDDLQPRADRVVSKRTPVNDQEVYTLMSKRLFKKVDRKEAERVARMYRETYQRTAGLYDATVLSEEYLQQQINAYPLHPELIDVLYKKWSTVSDFPRTRAVLQLLASVVADQWVNRREAYTIQSAHVGLERERIRTKVVSAAGSGGGYDGVVAADIIGGDAHADMFDQKRGGEYQRFHIARGLATTLLMHSFGGQTQLGALPQELRLGTVAPNVGPEYLADVVDSLEQTLWYVHREGELRRFQTKANVYRIIAQRAEAQPSASVTDGLRQALDSTVGSVEGFRVLTWAGSDDNIPDRPEPTLAVLEAKYALPSEEEDAKPVQEKIRRLWDRTGGGLRQWRNALILVAPDADAWRTAEEAMRQVMGYDSVLKEPGKGSQEVDKLELKGLESEFKDKKGSLQTAIVNAYRRVLHPDSDGLSEVVLTDQATKGDTIADRVVARLASSSYGTPKVLTKMGAVYFTSKIMPHVWKSDETPLELSELSRRFLEWTYLPLLPKKEDVLRACLREGVAQGSWGIATGDAVAGVYQRLIEKAAELDGLIALFDGTASLVRGPLLERLRKELGKPGEEPPGPPPPPKSPEPPEPPIPHPATRLKRVSLRLEKLPVSKTSNLQPYLFKVIQEQDAGAELEITIEVSSDAGISKEALEQKILQAFEQLGITLHWNPS